MILTNLRLSVSVYLPRDLMWTDEHSWSPVVASTDTTLTGAIVVDTALRKSGRAITLAAPREDMAWVSRATVDSLAGWAAVPGDTYQIQFDDGRSYEVMFRHHEPPVLESRPVAGFATFDPEHYWQITLKFTEI